VAAAPAAEPAPSAATTADAPASPAPAAAPADEAAATPAAASLSGAVAKADIKMVSGDKSLGTITFERADKTITINGQFTGLKKGQYALYIHSKGDCSDKGKKVGDHLNPTKAKHGPPASAMRHAGDFGNLTFDKEGNATFQMATDSITIEPDRADSVVGRAVVVHARKDNAKGSAGAPVACGVVMLDGASTETETTRSSYTGATPSPASAKTK
jgi:Cu/Zn superoxide dismutase